MCLYSFPFPVGRKIYSKLLMFKVFCSLHLKIFVFFVFNFCTFPTFYYTTVKFCLELRSQNCFTFFQNHWGSQRAKSHMGYNVPTVSIQNKNREFLKTRVWTNAHSTSQQSNDLTCYVTMERLTAHLWKMKKVKKKWGFYH